MAQINAFSFTMPTSLRFGCGVLDELAKNPLPGKRLMIVAGGNSVKKYGTLDRIREMTAKKTESVFVFDGVPQNPTRECVMEGTRFARENGVDVVIGVGGGSSMDAAKGIAMMASNEGDLWDYVQIGTGKRLPFARPRLPLILIPTTAGTGSEGNKTAVITNSETKEKVGVRTDFPSAAYVDPELTLSVPARFTALQGYDAFCHLMEAFVSVKATMISDAWAVQGMRELLTWLPKAVANGDDIEARTHVMYAASLGGIVIGISSCSSAHTLEHALSGINPKVEHGAGLAMVADAFHGTVAKNAPRRYAEAAELLGIVTDGMSDPEKAETLNRKSREMREACGIGELRLRNYGFTSADIDALVEMTHVVAGGPLSRDRYLMTDDELAAVFEDSL